MFRLLVKEKNRVICFPLVFLFTIMSTAGEGLLWAQAASAEMSPPILQIPSDLGELKDYYHPSDSLHKPFVIHIQDAHAHPEAQRRIRDLLTWIDSSSGSPLLIGLEAVVDTIHPEYLEFFPQYPEVNEEVIRDLLNKGELNGVELFAWEQ